MTINPPYLQPGDIIGVVCPSGSMPFENMQTCLGVLEKWGFRIKQGKTLGTQSGYFSGTDEERLADIQMMMDDDTIKAILCARGGYGLSRIIDKIDFKNFVIHPKWLIGYSDVTILHSHLFQNYQTGSLHSPMASAFNNGGDQTEYVRSLLKALSGLTYTYHCEAHNLNRQGTTSGKLVGGNLCLLAHMIGSISSIDTKEKLLFIEDISEYIYNVDRMMIQLKRAGKLDALAGLIIGSFTDTKDTAIPFGASAYECIYDKVKEYDYPVCFQFPVGHTIENYALKHGIVHTLDVKETGVSLIETR